MMKTYTQYPNFYILLSFVGIALGLIIPLKVSFTRLPTKKHSRLFDESTKSIYRDCEADSNADSDGNNNVPSRILINWKGEDVEGYSFQFRHSEFFGALTACMDESHQDRNQNKLDVAKIKFVDAVSYVGSSEMSDLKILRYNQSMQFILPGNISIEYLMEAARRCSLVHGLYLVVAKADSNSEMKYHELAEISLKNGLFQDLEYGKRNGNYTWSIRVRRFGGSHHRGKEARYSAKTRSVSEEQKALNGLKTQLMRFGGKVDLDHPDCKIYVFDGLKDNRTILARLITVGPTIGIINPNTRICVTNTPLCPIAAFSLCNIASIRRNETVLDPFAGSCATLLAAAMIEPSCSCVGIDIAHNGLVNRTDVKKDFTSRKLKEPVALFQGDFNSKEIRDQARNVIGCQPFDVIITDPPYGIRESKNTMEQRPIDGLFLAIAEDRNTGMRLLKKGGRLVLFIPCRPEEEDIFDALPTTDMMLKAGLQREQMIEQPLNSLLGRWLVSFVCTH